MSTTRTINAYAVLEAGGRFEPFSYEVGELHPDEVEIDVLHCGICHSDLSMVDNEWGMSKYPLVAGHEVIGRISARGSHVLNLEEGTVVGLGWHCGYCGHCHSCKTGDQNLCAKAQSTIVAHHGGFADKVRADASSVIAIVQFDVKPTDKVAVIGIGGLGHIALQFLNAWGCEVTAFTSSESKRHEALAIGAHKTLNSRNQGEIESAAGTFDFIISTVNVKLDWNLYVNTLKPKGRLHFVGATLEPLDLGAFSLITGQRSISGSPVGSPATIESMLEFARLHQVKPLVETYPMSKINDAFDHLKSGNTKYRIVLSNR